MPATILKICFLGIINAVAIWGIPAMVANGSWIMLAFVVASTAALDFLLLGSRYVPGKYVVIGAILLTAFQIIPVIFNISIAFTNYSTGNIGTQDDAITAIVRDSSQQTDSSPSYDMLPARNDTGDLVLILTPQDVGQLADSGSADAAASDEPSAQPGFDFGVPSASGAPMEFGGEDVAPSPVASDAGTDDMNLPTDAETSDYPPTYIGTDQGIDEVPASDVQRDEFGTVTGVTGLTVVPDADLASIDSQLAAFKVPGPQGGYIQPQGLQTAIELVPTLTYDPAADTFTSIGTGTVYVDNGRGNYANPADPQDKLTPGWRATVGFENFARVFNDPQIREPFAMVFIWTFLYALLSVLLTFVVGLGLAVVLNKERMRGQRVYRSLLIIPYAVPAFLSILVWAGLLNDDFGALNAVTGWDIPWLFDPFWARVSVLLVNLWLGFPYMFLVSTGALQAIPSELQEAARVDGARTFQVWRLVNMPLLLVALTPLLIASFAYNFNNFGGIYLLTGGGPAVPGSEVAGATDILISYTYKIAFAAGEGNDYGLAAAISIFIFFIVGTISALSFGRSNALREDRA
ncbi:MAG: ABC transporter permease subunit [Actinomycetales bacterium]|nr:ABC transporter permease subunit [Actinomycetales bacterium]